MLEGELGWKMSKVSQLPVETSLKPVDSECVVLFVVPLVISPDRIDHLISTVSGQHVRVVDRQSPDANDENDDEQDDNAQRGHDDPERSLGIDGHYVDDGERQRDDTDRQKEACDCTYREVRERVVVTKHTQVADSDDDQDNAKSEIDHVAKVEERLRFLDDLDLILAGKGVTMSCGLGRHVARSFVCPSVCRSNNSL